MKVFRKMFAFAVTVAAIAMATSAFAATAVYDNGLVKVTGTFDEDEQMTVAVITADFDGDDADIYYIDQDAAETIKANLQSGLAVKTALVDPAVNYEVRVAGTDMSMQEIYFNSIQVVEQPTRVEASNASAIGFKGSFQYNGGSKKVVITLVDDNADGRRGTLEWDLSNVGSFNAPITFGLEIQADDMQDDVSGIRIESIADAQAQ